MIYGTTYLSKTVIIRSVWLLILSAAYLSAVVAQDTIPTIIIEKLEDALEEVFQRQLSREAELRSQMNWAEAAMCRLGGMGPSFSLEFRAQIARLASLWNTVPGR